MPLRKFIQLLLLFYLQICSFLSSTPDLTIVGFVRPEDGIGKIPINILEMLNKDISANIIVNPFAISSEQSLPPSVKIALFNRDKRPGKVALLTEVLWHLGRKNAALVPSESCIKIAYSMLETTKIPKIWVKILNEEFDAVVLPDPYLVNVYQKSGVHIPIFMLPIPMILEPYLNRPMHSHSFSQPFIFGDASANKNPAILVEAFAKAFGDCSDVQLIMRAGCLTAEARESIRQLIVQFGLTNVFIQEGYLNLEQYIDLLSSFDCYVNLSKGEGFSLIPREALALGIPCILSNNTASMTICKSGCVRAVPSRKRVPALPIYHALFYESCGKQFDCEVEDVVAALRDVYEHYALYLKKAHKGRKWVNQYNCTNLKLRDSYLSLIKPKHVVIGSQNIIKNGMLITNSKTLYEKYWQLLQSPSS